MELSYQKIIHDYALVTYSDWNAVADITFAEMIRDAEDANRQDIVQILKMRQILTKMHRRGRPNMRMYNIRLQCGSAIGRLIGNTAQWMVGNHDTDYFGTLPVSVVNTICQYLVMRADSRVYFCGQQYA